jgi:outer membrane protein assembly factor BamB
MAPALERVTRNRPASIAARKVVDALGTGGDAEVLRVAQLVLDLEADSFNDDLTSVRLSVEARLRSATDEVRRRYDSVVGVDANRAFVDATAEVSVQQLRQVCRRFFLTPAGYAASERLIADWLDANEYGLAARLAEQVLAEPAHRPRITPRFRALAASAKAIGAAELQTESSVDELADVKPFRQQLQKYRRSLNPSESDWTLVGGDLSRTRIVDGSPPIPIASWSTDFFANQSSWMTREFLRGWEGDRRDVDQPCCPASFPLVIGDQIIFRDATGLRSVNAVRGGTNWSMACNYNPLAVVSRAELAVRGRMGFASTRQGTQNSLGENSLMGAISSVGRLVFVVDSNSVNSYEEVQDTGIYVRQFLNRLVAVHAVGPNAGRVAWVQDGSLPARFKKPDRATQFSFLGPPLPGPTELVCLTEHDDEVHLSGFETHSGAMLWTQPLCAVEQFEQFDPERHETACLPARADGIVVCPTNTGLLVAVDQVRLNLLWATFIDDLPDLKRQQIRGNPRSQALGYPGFMPHVMISDRRVIYLPSRSTLLHCLDLQTGKILWSIPRADAEFVGAVADNQVLVVGKQSCRSVSLQDGKEIWTTATGMPAGRGVALRNQYVLPLGDGHLALLDLKTGRDQGTKVLRSEIDLGHLVADRERVYSISQRGLVAFPQVDAVLARGEGPDVGRQHGVLMAEANLVIGKVREADRQLRVALASDLPTVDRERARKDLKELLFQRLADEPDFSNDDVATLDQLLGSPTEQFRFLIAAASRANDLAESSMPFARRTFRLSPGVLGAAIPGQEDWIISPAVWCRLQLSASQRKGFGSDIRRLLHDQALAQGTHSLSELGRYVRVFNDEPTVKRTRVTLASKLSAEGSLHASETLLLRNRSDHQPEVAAEAAMRLAELWEKSGFALDAAKQLNALTTEFADVPLSDGVTGQRHVERMAADRPAKRAWLQSRVPEWPVDHVEIRQTTAAYEFAEQVQAPLKGAESAQFLSDRQDIATPGRYFRAAPSTEFVMSPVNLEDQYHLSVFDQRTKLCLGSLMIAQAHRTPAADKFLPDGHLVPFGVPGGVLGVSTLQLGDSQPVWKYSPAELDGRKSVALPGPSGPAFASFSWRNRIYVVDPVDGALLWQRAIPMPSSDQRLELLGDSSALAVRITERPIGQNSDRKVTYEVFETATGRKLSTVRSGFIPGQWQGDFGRFIVGFADTPDGRRLQIRDLMKDGPEVSEFVSESARQPFIVPGTGELVYMGPGGEIKIFDIQRGRKNLSVQLNPTELLPVSVIRVFSDHSRFFVNLQRPTPTATTTHSNQPINTTQIPGGMPIRDDLYAFDRATGELLWKRAVPYRTLLNFPDSQVPFLVTISLVKDRVNNTLQSLTIEVIDSRSGTTIGFRENLSFDHLLTAHYDGEAGRILLRGQASDIELRFGPAEGQTQAAHK